MSVSSCLFVILGMHTIYHRVRCATILERISFFYQSLKMSFPIVLLSSPGCIPRTLHSQLNFFYCGSTRCTPQQEGCKKAHTPLAPNRIVCGKRLAAPVIPMPGYACGGQRVFTISQDAAGRKGVVWRDDAQRKKISRCRLILTSCSGEAGRDDYRID